MAIGFVWHERYMWHNTGLAWQGDTEPTEHFENPETKRRFKNLLDATELSESLVWLKPREASEEELLRIHTRPYVERIQELSASGGGNAGEGTPFGQGSYEIAKLAAGGTIVAVDAVMRGEVRQAYALVRPPGHHAERDLGRGFCIFANVAIAAAHARAEWGVQRIATVDWDVHHGNGTEQAFYADPHVLTISLHQDGLYPPKSGAVESQGSEAGEGYNVNIPLPAGSGRGAYRAAMERVVAPALRAFGPELILVPSGFDASAADPLGRMMLTAEGYRELTRIVLGLAEELCEGRLVFSHEGGYSKHYVPFCGLAVMEVLTGIRTEIDEPFATWDDLPGQELQPHQESLIEALAADVAGRFG